MSDKYLTVSAITRYLKAKFDVDENLQTVFLKGEISNFKAHTTGHFYFSLKDESSKINAIMFRSNASKVLFKPVDGMKVLVTVELVYMRLWEVIKYMSMKCLKMVLVIYI